MEPGQKAVEYTFYELFGCFYELLTKRSKNSTWGVNQGMGNYWYVLPM